MATKVYVFYPIRSSRFDRTTRRTLDARPCFRISGRHVTPFSLPTGIIGNSYGVRFYATAAQSVRRNLTSLTASMVPGNPVVNDVCSAALAACVALSLLRIWGETAKRGIFDQKLNRKLVHISIGLVFMLFWPLFSSGRQGAVLAALIPGVNIIRVLMLGLGLWKDEATVKSMSRFGDYRELLKGPLYYASTITLASVIYWRTSPIAIAAICNLCAGDGNKKDLFETFAELFGSITQLGLCILFTYMVSGLADIVGRRFGSHKIPYNRNKSFAGSIAMVVAGFTASVGYMHYFSFFGFIQESLEMVLGFFIVSIATAIVESLPISTELDDNLTVPLTSVLVGSLVF